MKVLLSYLFYQLYQIPFVHWKIKYENKRKKAKHFLNEHQFLHITVLGNGMKMLRKKIGGKDKKCEKQ